MLGLASALLLAPLPSSGSRPAVLHPEDSVYAADVAFALDELEQRCGPFIEQKDIDWKSVRREIEKSAKTIATDEEEFVLLVRLLARLRDGHAEVRPGPGGGDLPVPEEWKVAKVGPGFFLCQVGDKLYVKAVWSSAKEVGLEPGAELLSVDGTSARKWFDQKRAELRDLRSFSTEQHELFAALHHGFLAPAGTRMDVEFKPEGGKKHKRTITYGKASVFIEGPAVVPAGAQWAGESVRYGKSPAGYGYVQVRKVRDQVIEELDRALADVADCRGLVLDFRGNTGGGCDHDAFEARFVPAGKELPRLARPPLASAGPAPYGGPIVVIVDGTVVSAGETTSGMLKEDGRAYMIGESPTAGMSSQKEELTLPSGKFKLYVSVGTNRSSFNGGRGIEGLGVSPHELVTYSPKDLAKGVDTLIARAETLLADFPKSKVAYDPADYGWK